jgi:hypothetical protein
VTISSEREISHSTLNHRADARLFRSSWADDDPRLADAFERRGIALQALLRGPFEAGSATEKASHPSADDVSLTGRVSTGRSGRRRI